MELDKLIKWPSRVEDVTVDGMIRCIANDTQREYLAKMSEMSATDQGEPFMASPLYHSRTLGIISAVGLIGCLRALRQSNPEAALTFARDYWTMCDAGDAFGEWLWEWAGNAGLDLELVKPR